MRTNEFNNDPRYSNQVTIGIEETAGSRALIVAAVKAAHGLWREGYRYSKAGVLLLDLYHPHELPAASLFPSRDPEKSKALMTALDAINGRFGRDMARPGGLVAARAWAMRRGNLSPCYTTRLDDLLKVQT